VSVGATLRDLRCRLQLFGCLGIVWGCAAIEFAAERVSRRLFGSWEPLPPSPEEQAKLQALCDHVNARENERVWGAA
jgi:hypothetical protein